MTSCKLPQRRPHSARRRSESEKQLILMTSCIYLRYRGTGEDRGRMEEGEEVARLLGDLGSNLPVADFDIGSSDEVSISVVPTFHPSSFCLLSACKNT